MIRLRNMLERGRAHPLLGPILLLVLVLLLTMVFLHVLEDGSPATEIGAVCLAVATVLGLLLAVQGCSRASEPSVTMRGDRGPPRNARHLPSSALLAAAGYRSLPLRR